MSYILETARLRLRELTTGDTQFIIELLNTPGWLQYIGDRNVKTADQAKKYLDNGPIKSYKENGFGLSLVEKKDDNAAIGMCGLLKRDTLDFPDIGFAFLPSYNGKGYAYEIAAGVLNYAKDKFKIARVVAITVPDNQRSIRLLENLGFIFTKTISSPTNEELLLYSNQMSL